MKSSNHITAIRIITALLIGMIIVACQPVTEDSNSVLGRLATSENIISVTDFTGAELVFSEPVESIVALSPHIVENIYAVGASDRLSGVVEYSNFPPQATELPIVASFEKTNIERIVELNPDLIMGLGVRQFTQRH